ncbi:MAG: hypothetical protein GX021_06600 [Tissierellia bacterium]|nr:hypothetical protein [Tissierellia bacterium]
MGVAKKGAFNIYNGLIHKFLYKNDINSIHILLNLFDIEDNIKNICPKYISTYHIKKHISRRLKQKNNNHLISLNLGQLIHEDIHRLELYIYLEGYRNGYFNNNWANVLEKVALENIPLDDLYKKNYLYHFDLNNKQAKRIRELIEQKLDEIENKSKDLQNHIIKYCENILKGKILSLNRYLDKQLTIDYNLKTYSIKEDYSLLTLEELNYIYNEVVKVVLKSGFKLYKEAYWYGLNDRVLKRYR